MTLSTTQARYQYAGNGVTTSFSFPAVFIAPADIAVDLRDAAGAAYGPVLNGARAYDYTISGALDATTGEYLSGANFVFNNAPPSGYRVTLYRAPAMTQSVKLSAGGSFPADTVNTEFDKLTMLSQFLGDQLARALTIPVDDLLSLSMVLPSSAVRAGQLLGFDSNGGPALFLPTAQNLAVLGQVWKSGAAFSATAGYGASDLFTQVEAVLASIAVPNAAQDAVAIFQKTSSSSTNYQAVNPTLYASLRMRNGSATSRGCAAFFETRQEVNRVGDGNFIEGSRSHGIIAAGVSGCNAYGALMVAGEEAGGTHLHNIIAAEAEIINQTADAPYATVDLNVLEAAYLATSFFGTKKPLAAFLINPFTPAVASWQIGFYVPPSALDDIGAPVVGAAFRSDAKCFWGLDLLGRVSSGGLGGPPTFGAIGIANNSPIRASNAAKTQTPSILALDSSDHLLVGFDDNVLGVLIGRATKDLGFYGTTPAPKQAVTGSRGGNAALASLLTKLATIGLVTDSSTA